MFVDNKVWSYLTYWAYGQTLNQILLITLNTLLLTILTSRDKYSFPFDFAYNESSNIKLNTVKAWIKFGNILLIVWFIMGIILLFGFSDISQVSLTFNSSYI
jgi:hypothetical protein